jgi:hypothetical protein
MNSAGREAIVLEHLFCAQHKASVVCDRLQNIHNHFHMDTITQGYLNRIFEDCIKMQTALDIAASVLARK